jgi:hypothetical protein
MPPTIAVQWPMGTSPQGAGSALEHLAAAVPLSIRAAELPAAVTAELTALLPEFPGAALAEFTAWVGTLGGKVIELWRLPPDQRRLVSLRAFPPSSTYEFTEVTRAAAAVSAWLQNGGTSSHPAHLSADASAAALLERLREDRRRRSSARREPGAEAALELVFPTDAHFVKEHAANISRGGLFVPTRARAQLDSVVGVRVVLPSGARVEGQARVVQATDGGLCLTFLREAPALREALNAYLSTLR